MNEQQGKATSRLRFIDYVVDHVEFTNNPAFNAESVDIKFDIRHEVALEIPDAYVTVHLNIFTDAEANNYPFSFSVSTTGHFQIDAENPEDAMAFLNVNAVAILFPYVRALVTTYTANANVPPLILPPMNIAKMLEKATKEDGENAE
jgi:preprotein translocase subunit SecB